MDVLLSHHPAPDEDRADAPSPDPLILQRVGQLVRADEPFADEDASQEIR
jgi:hypothetical protein